MELPLGIFHCMDRLSSQGFVPSSALFLSEILGFVQFSLIKLGARFYVSNLRFLSIFLNSLVS